MNYKDILINYNEVDKDNRIIYTNRKYINGRDSFIETKKIIYNCFYNVCIWNPYI